MEIYKLYCSICFARCQKNILINLNPSSGGTGIKLKSANEIFTDENNNRKFAKTSQLPKRTDSLNPTINE
jgi:hypothetical protein